MVQVEPENFENSFGCKRGKSTVGNRAFLCLRDLRVKEILLLKIE